jgi:citrate lyase subunit beta/citryl-CoA lyase
VALEPRSAGGIEIEVEFRVAPYYGLAIRVQAQEVLEALGVVYARLSIHDEGALPFVIARIEAAARRAGLGEGRRALPETISVPAPSARDRLRRSRLYLPANPSTSSTPDCTGRTR